MKKYVWTNWSHSYQSFPEKFFTPSTEQEIIDIVQTATARNKKIKVVGSGHSCAKIAQQFDGYLLSLEKFNKIIKFNSQTLELIVEGGTSLKDICIFLKKNNAALANMGTIDPQSIAGAISTGTHGTGIKFEAIDQQIKELEIITSDGSKQIFTKETPEFNHAVVSIGSIGIISKVTLQCVPFYNLEVREKSISFDKMTTHLDLIHQFDFVRFWWVPHTDRVQLWTANKTDKLAIKKNRFSVWFKGIFKGNIIHEIGLWLTSFNPKLIPILNKLMHQLLFAKKEYAIADFHSMFTLPIHIKQSVMEYGIPIEHTLQVVTEMHAAIANNDFKVHMPIELRFAPQNEASLSMAYKTATCYIGIISYKPFGKKIEHDVYFEKIHQIFAKYQGRPHWAKKHFYQTTTLQKRYPAWEQFVKFKNAIDPKKTFENDFLKELFSR